MGYTNHFNTSINPVIITCMSITKKYHPFEREDRYEY